jgi:hypothetical protein
MCGCMASCCEVEETSSYQQLELDMHRLGGMRRKPFKSGESHIGPLLRLQSVWCWGVCMHDTLLLLLELTSAYQQLDMHRLGGEVVCCCECVHAWHVVGSWTCAGSGCHYVRCLRCARGSLT